MITAPNEFRQFILLADQDSDEYSKEEIIKQMYEYLSFRVQNKDGWLRRGKVVISFLEEALNGPYGDGELAEMWLESGSQVFVPAPYIRPWLTFVLDQVRIYQAQNVAGTYEPYRWTGDDG